MSLLFENKSDSSKQKGFSLVELAVVVSIIGIIISAVIGGKKLYDAAKLRRVSTEIMQYSSAINTFKEEYGYWPGDFPQASNFWSGAANGNGDGVIRFQFLVNNEDLYSWDHLENAELIKDQYDGVVKSGTIHYSKGENLPVSAAFENITFAFYSFRPAGGNVVYDNITGIKMIISSLSATGAPASTTNSFQGKQAQAIDEKIDDGMASSGNLISYRTAGGCTDADESTSSRADYQLNNTIEDCVVEWYIDRL